MKVTVYSTPNCVQCMTTKRHMDRLGIRYESVDLSERPDLLDEFRSKGYTTAPIVTTDVKIWSGYRHDKIVSLAQHLNLEKVHDSYNDITKRTTNSTD